MGQNTDSRRKHSITKQCFSAASKQQEVRTMIEINETPTLFLSETMIQAL